MPGIEVRTPADATSIRLRLRVSTTPLHARVDAYMGGLLGRADRGYEQFLTATARGVLPLERALGYAGVSDVVRDWPRRARSEALRADLATLSLAEPDPHIVYEDPGLCDEAYMLGAIYVLEGSRLGARVVLGTLENAPIPVHECATRYLSHGQGLPLWQTFLAQLETSLEVRKHPERTEAGASAAFHLFLRGTERTGTLAQVRCADG